MLHSMNSIKCVYLFFCIDRRYCKQHNAASTRSAQPAVGRVVRISGFFLSYSPNRLVGKPIQKRSRLGQDFKVALQSDVAVSLKILEAHEPGRVTVLARLGSSQVAEDLLEERLIAGNRERTGVGKPEFLLGLNQ